jgi:hypothetical protein
LLFARQQARIGLALHAAYARIRLQGRATSQGQTYGQQEWNAY